MLLNHIISVHRHTYVCNAKASNRNFCNLLISEIPTSFLTLNYIPITDNEKNQAEMKPIDFTKNPPCTECPCPSVCVPSQKTWKSCHCWVVDLSFFPSELLGCELDRCISSSCVVKCHGDFSILGMNYIWHVNQIIIIIIHFGSFGQHQIGL